MQLLCWHWVGIVFKLTYKEWMKWKWASCTWIMQTCSLYIGIHCCWSVHCMLYVHMVSEMAENYANGPADIDAMGEFLLISFTKFYNGRLLKMSILRPFLYYMKPAYSKAKLMQMAQLCKVPRFRASCISRWRTSKTITASCRLHQLSELIYCCYQMSP